MNAHSYPYLGGIRTHDPSARAVEDGSYLRLRGQYDRQKRHNRVLYKAGLVIKSDELQTESRNFLGMPTLNTSYKLALLWECLVLLYFIDRGTVCMRGLS
jgi:hypothetical protein